MRVADVAEGIPPYTGPWQFERSLVRGGCVTEFLKSNPGFQRALLPRSRRATTLLNQRIRARGRFIPPSATTKADSLYGRVGQAVDRAAIHLIGGDVMAIPRAVLRERLGKTAARILEALEFQAERELPTRLDLKCTETLGWLWVIGMIEPIYRGFRPLSDIDVTGLESAPVIRRSAIRWLGRLVAKDVVQELTALIRALTGILPKGPYRSTPGFGSYGFMSGGDGDLIARDTLVEIKCSVAGVARESVAQLFCYVATDHLRQTVGNDCYGLGRLALCLPRQQVTIVGTVAEWLTCFGGPPLRDFVALFSKYAATSSHT